MIELTCTCGQVLEVGEEFAGQTGECPSCGTEIQVPGRRKLAINRAAAQSMPDSPVEPAQQEPAGRRLAGVTPPHDLPSQNHAAAVPSCPATNSVAAGLVQPKRVRDYYIVLFVLVALVLMAAFINNLAGTGTNASKADTLKGFCEATVAIGRLLASGLMFGIPVVATCFTVRNFRRRGMPKQANLALLTNVGLLIGYVVVGFIQPLIANLAYVAIPIYQYVGIKKSVAGA